MSKLLIDQMTQEIEGLDKTAEEAEVEKIAGIILAVEQSQTLTSAGQELYKIAEDIDNEKLAALAADTYHLGERFGACLSKTASDETGAEAFEIAEDLYKVASAWASIGDDLQDEDFSKVASAIIEIYNGMAEDIEEVEKKASILAPDYEKGNKTKLKRSAFEGASNKEIEAARKLIADQKTADGLKTCKSGKTFIGQMHSKALQLKIPVKAHPYKATAIGAGTLAALAAAGYGVSRLNGK